MKKIMGDPKKLVRVDAVSSDERGHGTSKTAGEPARLARDTGGRGTGTTLPGHRAAAQTGGTANTQGKKTISTRKIKTL